MPGWSSAGRFGMWATKWSVSYTEGKVGFPHGASGLDY